MKERDGFRDMGVEWRIILKIIISECDV